MNTFNYFFLLVALFFCSVGVVAKPFDDYKKYEGVVRWESFPKITFTDELLECQDRSVTVTIYVDESGNVVHARIAKSSGIADLDNLIVSVFKELKVSRIKMNNVYPKFFVDQKLELRTRFSHQCQ